MMGYIAMGNLNIRIHRDITDEMWFEEDSMKMVLMNFCEGQSNLTGKTPFLIVS